MDAVDTNVLVRLIVRDDAKQAAAAEKFVGTRGAWVSVLALAEAMWVLRAVYNLDAAQIALAVNMLLQHRSLVLQDHDAVAKALEEFRKHPALGFSDCLMLELARKSGYLPLATFDRNLAKIKGAVKL
jgi:predicted nucleic-acid-binding protein